MERLNRGAQKTQTIREPDVRASPISITSCDGRLKILSRRPRPLSGFSGGGLVFQAVAQ